MKRFAFAPVLFALSLAGCPHPVEDYVRPVTDAAIDCGKELASKQALKHIGPVNDCLTGDDTQSCLLSYGAQVGMDLMYCVVRRAGSDYLAMSQANPNDKVAAVGAVRARNFLVEQDVTFVDGQ